MYVYVYVCVCTMYACVHHVGTCMHVCWQKDKCMPACRWGGGGVVCGYREGWVVGGMHARLLACCVDLSRRQLERMTVQTAHLLRTLGRKSQIAHPKPCGFARPKVLYLALASGTMRRTAETLPRKSLSLCCEGRTGSGLWSHKATEAKG